MEMRVRRPMLRAGLVLAIISSLATAVVGGFVGYVLFLIGAIADGVNGGEALPAIFYVDLALFVAMVIISLVVVGLSIAGLIKSNLPLEQFAEKKGLYTAIFVLLIITAGILALFVLLTLINSSSSGELSADKILESILLGAMFLGLVISAILVGVSRKGGKVQKIVDNVAEENTQNQLPNRQVSNSTINDDEDTPNQDIIDKAV